MPAPSEIITLHGERLSKTGMRLGERGLAMLGSSTVPAHPDPDLAAVILRSSLVFNGLLADTEEEVEAVYELVEYLEKPATRQWIAGRALSLLSQYFAPNMEEAVSKAIADDWCEMLSSYPAWAIANGCRWWMGRENPHKARRPLAGDIQEAAYREMERVRVARITLGRGLSRPYEPEPPRPELTPEDLARRAEYAATLLRGFGQTNKGEA